MIGSQILHSKEKKLGAFSNTSLQHQQIQQAVAQHNSNNLAGLLHVSWRLCFVLSYFAPTIQKKLLYSRQLCFVCTVNMAHRRSSQLANQLTAQLMTCLSGKMCSAQLGSHIVCSHNTQTQRHTHTHTQVSCMETL